MPRHRSHSISPQHLGDSGGAAALVALIGGLALTITAIAITVQGLGLPGRYAADPPPNAAALGTPQVIGGAALLVLGLALAGGAGALLSGVRGSRVVVVAVTALTALLSVVGFVMLIGETRRDIVLVSALGVSAVAFAGAAFVLARLRS